MTVQGITSFRETPAGPRRTVDAAIRAAEHALRAQQRADGHWCGELEGDTILESEFMLLLYFLGRAAEPRFAKCAAYLRRSQLPGGGWAIYRGGPPELSGSVKAYFALKLAGDPADAAHMQRARETILALGGIERCNSFTKIYLSIFGQYERETCPAVPPELVLLPPWFLFSIYRISYWSRCILVPLSIIWALAPRCEVPQECGLAELRVEAPPNRDGRRPRRERFWRRVFRLSDAVLKMVERSGFRPLRRRALARAERWTVEHMEGSAGVGAIFPPIVNAVFALRALGYRSDHPLIRGQLAELERLEIDDGETVRLQPCFSPVWDTALSLHVLRECGVPGGDPVLLSAARWLIAREVRVAGDWKFMNRSGLPGGWFFQYANAFYPDTDDTSEVLLALAGVRFPTAAEERARRAAIARGVAWQLSMQNRDGGWGAFDKECNNDIFTFIPFADHNAMIDPSCEDITGRTIEALMALGFDASHPAVACAVRFLHERQEAGGTWFGRWGCNHIYGTFLALRGLAVAGASGRNRAERAVRWLREHQNDDGGWGELPASYDDPAMKGIGPSTPTQTAWALLGLIAGGAAATESARRGVAYLLSRQHGGTWTDEYWNATGFPRVFYLRYHLYATYFPLWALAEYRRATAAPGRDGAA